MRKTFIIGIMFLCAAAAAFSLWRLWGIYGFYHKGKMEYDDLTEFVEETGSPDDGQGSSGTSDKTGESRTDECPISVNFKALSGINPEIAGWIFIPGTGISYPLVRHEDNSYYLHRTFGGERSDVGAIFLDCRCRQDFDSDNSIIYGHNLKNGEMFGSLKKYYDREHNRSADPGNHPVVWILTPHDEMEYQVFAVRRISAGKDRDVYTSEFSGPDAYREFLDRQVRQSSYVPGIRPSPDRPMITLSTCTSGGEEQRLIVQAVRIQ